MRYRALIATTAALVSGCSSFGTSPSEEERKLWVNTQSIYDLTANEFKNQNPAFRNEVKFWAMFKGFMSGDEIRVPTAPLPVTTPNLEAINQDSPELSFIWLGHSSFLMQLDGKRVLIDPVFEDYASPVPIFGRRFQKPPLTREQLPPIDLILISHDHYDHLEMETARYFAGKNTKFFVPLGIGARLRGWGVGNEQIQEFDWWQKAHVGPIEITCTPAQHFSGRSLFDRNATLWASWAIKGSQRSMFFSGDSGFYQHYKTIGERLGPFDVTFLENGQYNDLWPQVHQLPEEAVSAHKDLRGALLVPIHWGAFELSFHHWFEPVERLVQEAAKQQVNVLTPMIGALHSTSSTEVGAQWWRETPDVTQFLQTKLHPDTHK